MPTERVVAYIEALEGGDVAGPDYTFPTLHALTRAEQLAAHDWVDWWRKSVVVWRLYGYRDFSGDAADPP